MRDPNIDRDFVLGELGKTSFESGNLEQARAYWRQIGHKIYAGTRLRNNGLLEDAIEIFQAGIRLQPDDFGLHRNLVRTLQDAGRTDEALEAAQRLLDLEPENIFNIQRLAQAYLDRNDRATAAKIAARLLSADVREKHQPGAGGAGAAASYNNFGYYGGFNAGRSNLMRGIQFFLENGLRGELEQVLSEQLALQPENAVLKNLAAQHYSTTFGKPEKALDLLVELESASFPIEYQEWLGQSSQRDHFRVQQFQLISQKPALRDQRLTALESKSAENLSRDELLELAVIRQSQGKPEQSIAHLRQALEKDAEDGVALSARTDGLLLGERCEEA
ncbi:MAG: tetratricopeptide repeat protein, partial [Phycisphaerae bacterium]